MNVVENVIQVEQVGDGREYLIVVGRVLVEIDQGSEDEIGSAVRADPAGVIAIPIFLGEDVVSAGIRVFRSNDPVRVMPAER